MNQQLISGVGNYIKCEALFLSKLSPHRILSSLNLNELKLLFNENITDFKDIGTYYKYHE